MDGELQELKVERRPRIEWYPGSVNGVAVVVVGAIVFLVALLVVHEDHHDAVVTGFVGFATAAFNFFRDRAKVATGTDDD